MADDIFPDLNRIKACDEVLSDQVRRHGVLYYADEHYTMYMYKGDIHVLPPLEDPSTVYWDLDMAVREAGFSTEELRHCLQELYECLYVRMLEDGMRGFSQREYDAVLKAKELLGLT